MLNVLSKHSSCRKGRKKMRSFRVEFRVMMQRCRRVKVAPGARGPHREERGKSTAASRSLQRLPDHHEAVGHRAPSCPKSPLKSLATLSPAPVSEQGRCKSLPISRPRLAPALPQSGKTALRPVHRDARCAIDKFLPKVAMSWTTRVGFPIFNLARLTATFVR